MRIILSILLLAACSSTPKSAVMFIRHENGKIRSAADSKGKKVELGYDDKGRINDLDGLYKETVQIFKYDEKTGKPVFLKHGDNYMKVIYQPNGEIERVYNVQPSCTGLDRIPVHGCTTEDMNY